MSDLYDRDFYAWTQTQAAALAAGHVSELDLANLAEEIESLGNRERKELRSYLEGVLLHLLKWRYQPQRRTRNWQNSIGHGRDRIPLCLEESPSLAPKLPELLSQAYRLARRGAARQTRLPLGTFPETCEWMVEQVMDEDFYPEASP